MRKPLVRDVDNAMIGGVVAGIAKYFDHDVTLWRLAVVFGMIITGLFPIFILYLIAWVIMPASDRQTKSYDYSIDD